MPEFTLGTKTVTLRPSDIIGGGGEADIYRKGGEAYKVFKPPTHIDVKGQPHLEAEARGRLAEHQQKLPALMALVSRLPRKVATPVELLRDKHGLVAGYQMNYIDPAEVLLRYGERGYRDQNGIPDDLMRDVLVDLHKTVDGAHRAGLVFGDFNDLNVLVKGRDAFVIDADSAQFGPFMARMFTGKFVDPLICDPRGSALLMMRPHGPETDWYAYLIMLMQSLLYVGPYGGVYRPADPKKNTPHDARPLKRITVFNSEVRYPKPARPFKILPDVLLDLFERTFVKDVRGTPPLSVIEGLRFTKCSKCGTTHARSVCPDCVGITAPMVKEVHTGKVTATKVFETSGQILFAAMQHGQLRYLYHEGGAYLRDGRKLVVQSPLEPHVRYRIQGNQTLIASMGKCFVFGSAARETISVDSYRLLPLIDANAERIFWAHNGALLRSGDLGLEYPERVGDVLSGQTLFWTGDRMGFGFYRAAELSNFFVFRTEVRGLNDSVVLPPIRGQLVDSTACLASHRVWFMTSTQEGGRAVNRCHLVDERGAHLGSAETSPGDGSWLGGLRGKCAAGDYLLAPTDDGIVRVVLNNGALEVGREFPDTARFVSASSHIFAGNDGVYVVERDVIWRLTIR